MIANHKRDSPIVSNAIKDASRESIATLVSAEKEMADLIQELERSDVNYTATSAQNHSLTDKMAIFIGLCEKKLARYSVIDVDGYWKRMQSFPEDGIPVDSIDNHFSDLGSVDGTGLDEATSITGSLDRASADEDSVGKRADRNADQKLAQKYWKSLRRGNKHLLGPRRANRGMQTKVILLLGGRDAAWNNQGSGKSGPQTKHERIEQIFDKMINKLKKDVEGMAG